MNLRDWIGIFSELATTIIIVCSPVLAVLAICYAFKKFKERRKSKKKEKVAND